MRLYLGSVQLVGRHKWKRFDPFYIGFAVSREKYNEFLVLSGKQNKSVPLHTSGMDVVPLTYADACEYCEWYHMRLPTREEWNAADLDGATYPWTSMTKKGALRCVDNNISEVNEIH